MERTLFSFCKQTFSGFNIDKSAMLTIYNKFNKNRKQLFAYLLKKYPAANNTFTRIDHDFINNIKDYIVKDEDLTALMSKKMENIQPQIAVICT